MKFHKHVRHKRKEIDQSRSSFDPLEGLILDRDWSISLRLRLTCLWNFMCDGHDGPYGLRYFLYLVTLGQSTGSIAAAHWSIWSYTMHMQLSNFVCEGPYVSHKSRGYLSELYVI